MSFDLKVKNGNLVISGGQLVTVEGTDKLAQDIVKIIITPAGSNVFYPWYGSILSKVSIGSSADFTFINSFAESQIRDALEKLRLIQERQIASGQRVTAAEQLAAIQYIKITQNTVDPTMWIINVRVLSKALSSTDVNLNISL